MADSEWADLIGKSYLIDARGPDSYDCYGVLIEMYRRKGVILPEFVSPRNDADIAQMLDVKTPKWVACEKEPGVGVLLRIGRHISHVGYVLEHDRMIHCWERSGGVCVEPLSEWRHRIHGYFKYAQ